MCPVLLRRWYQLREFPFCSNRLHTPSSRRTPFLVKTAWSFPFERWSTKTALSLLSLSSMSWVLCLVARAYLQRPQQKPVAIEVCVWMKFEAACSKMTTVCLTTRLATCAFQSRARTAVSSPSPLFPAGIDHLLDSETVNYAKKYRHAPPGPPGMQLSSPVLPSTCVQLACSIASRYAGILLHTYCNSIGATLSENVWLLATLTPWTTLNLVNEVVWDSGLDL